MKSLSRSFTYLEEQEKAFPDMVCCICLGLPLVFPALELRCCEKIICPSPCYESLPRDICPYCRAVQPVVTPTPRYLNNTLMSQLRVSCDTCHQVMSRELFDTQHICSLEKTKESKKEEEEQELKEFAMKLVGAQQQEPKAKEIPLDVLALAKIKWNDTAIVGALGPQIIMTKYSLLDQANLILQNARLLIELSTTPKQRFNTSFASFEGTNAKVVQTWVNAICKALLEHQIRISTRVEQQTRVLALLIGNDKNLIYQYIFSCNEMYGVWNVTDNARVELSRNFILSVLDMMDQVNYRNAYDESYFGPKGITREHYESHSDWQWYRSCLEAYNKKSEIFNVLYGPVRDGFGHLAFAVADVFAPILENAVEVSDPILEVLSRSRVVDTRKKYWKDRTKHERNVEFLTRMLESAKPPTLDQIKRGAKAIQNLDFDEMNSLVKERFGGDVNFDDVLVAVSASILPEDEQEDVVRKGMQVKSKMYDLMGNPYTVEEYTRRKKSNEERLSLQQKLLQAEEAKTFPDETKRDYYLAFKLWFVRYLDEQAGVVDLDGGEETDPEIDNALRKEKLEFSEVKALAERIMEVHTLQKEIQSIDQTISLINERENMSPDELMEIRDASEAKRNKALDAVNDTAADLAITEQEKKQLIEWYKRQYERNGGVVNVRRLLSVVDDIATRFVLVSESGSNKKRLSPSIKTFIRKVRSFLDAQSEYLDALDMWRRSVPAPEKRITSDTLNAEVFVAKGHAEDIVNILRNEYDFDISGPEASNARAMIAFYKDERFALYAKDRENFLDQVRIRFGIDKAKMEQILPTIEMLCKRMEEYGSAVDRLKGHLRRRNCSEWFLTVVFLLLWGSIVLLLLTSAFKTIRPYLKGIFGEGSVTSSDDASSKVVLDGSGAPQRAGATEGTGTTSTSTSDGERFTLPTAPDWTWREVLGNPFRWGANMVQDSAWWWYDMERLSLTGMIRDFQASSFSGIRIAAAVWTGALTAHVMLVRFVFAASQSSARITTEWWYEDDFTIAWQNEMQLARANIDNAKTELYFALLNTIMSIENSRSSAAAMLVQIGTVARNGIMSVATGGITNLFAAHLALPSTQQARQYLARLEPVQRSVDNASSADFQQRVLAIADGSNRNDNNLGSAATVAAIAARPAYADRNPELTVTDITEEEDVDTARAEAARKKRQEALKKMKDLDF